MKQKFANFSFKITKSREIVIHGFHGSWKWWNVKLRSHSILVIFDPDPSLETINQEWLSIGKQNI